MIEHRQSGFKRAYPASKRAPCSGCLKPAAFLLRMGFIACLLPLSASCTHSLHQGELQTLDHQGKERTYRIYWTKTRTASGPSSMSPVFIDIGCGRSEFAQRGVSYFLELPSSQYELTEGTSDASRLRCGEIYAETPLAEIDEGKLQLMIYCRPKVGQYSLFPSSFPMSRYAPYRIDIRSSTHPSLSLSPPKPEPLSCL